MDDGNTAVRFIHTADWHLGKSYRSRRDENGIPLELCWTRDAAGELVDYVRAHEIPIVLMCGDILHRRNPSPTTDNILAAILHDLSDLGVTVVYLLGNHEVTGWGDHPAKIYDTLNIPRVIIADTASIHRLEVPGGAVQVATIPYPAILQDSFGNIMRNLIESIDVETKSILMAHVFTEGAKLSGGDMNLLPTEPHIKPAMLHGTPFDYIALGHIHRYQQVIANPAAVYAGSLQRITFAEEGELKGFVDVQITRNNEGTRAKWHFIPVKATRFVTMDLDICGHENAMEIAETKILATAMDDAVVRIIVHRRSDDPKPSIPTLRKMAISNGAAIILINEDIERGRSEKILALPATGDVLTDIEKYIRSMHPKLSEKIPQILEIIAQLNR